MISFLSNVEIKCLSTKFVCVLSIQKYQHYFIHILVIHFPNSSDDDGVECDHVESTAAEGNKQQADPFGVYVAIIYSSLQFYTTLLRQYILHTLM